MTETQWKNCEMLHEQLRQEEECCEGCPDWGIAEICECCGTYGNIHDLQRELAAELGEYEEW